MDKWRYKTIAQKSTISFSVLMYFLLASGIAFSTRSEATEKEELEYRQDFKRIEDMRRSLSPEMDKESVQRDPEGATKKWEAFREKNDLNVYEEFADEIQNKWKDKNKNYYARLMLSVCSDLSFGNFKDKRCYDLKRKYVLSALEDPNEIELITELELTGHVQTDMYSRLAPKGADFVQLRKQDVDIKLHAWKRLLDAIDTGWNPNNLPQRNITPLAETGLPSGISPEAIEDPLLRAEYEAAIEANRQKAERYTEQNRLHKWLKRLPKHVEPYIIRAYSLPPFNSKELGRYLDKYIADENTKTRILNAVTKNIDK